MVRGWFAQLANADRLSSSNEIRKVFVIVFGLCGVSERLLLCGELGDLFTQFLRRLRILVLDVLLAFRIARIAVAMDVVIGCPEHQKRSGDDRERLPEQLHEFPYCRHGCTVVVWSVEVVVCVAGVPHVWPASL